MSTDVVATIKTKQALKMPSMWNVIFHNDDFTPMDFVAEVIKTIFNKSDDEAHALMLKVHEEGKAVVAQYTKEIAITKARQVVALAEDYNHPLKCTAEPG